MNDVQAYLFVTRQCRGCDRFYRNQGWGCGHEKDSSHCRTNSLDMFAEYVRVCKEKGRKYMER